MGGYAEALVGPSDIHAGLLGVLVEILLGTLLLGSVFGSVKQQCFETVQGCTVATQKGMDLNTGLSEPSMRVLRQKVHGRGFDISCLLSVIWVARSLRTGMEQQLYSNTWKPAFRVSELTCAVGKVGRGWESTVHGHVREATM